MKTEKTFQEKVRAWVIKCFGLEIADDVQERNNRFLEEALELVQATGCTAQDAHALVDYVYGRPIGDREQEVGGTLVTLASLCAAIGIDLEEAGNIEIERISTSDMIKKIRKKQESKPHLGPLPGKY